MIGNTKLFIVDIENSTIEKLKDLFFNNPQLGISFIGHAQNYNNCLNELSRAKEADAFLISAYLPDTMGYELIQHIKKANPKAKVIITLETTTRNLAELCLQKGADGILQKPFKAKELVNKIDELVNKPKPKEDFDMFGNTVPTQSFEAPPSRPEQTFEQPKPTFQQPKQSFNPFGNQEPKKEERPAPQPAFEQPKPVFEPKQEEKRPFFFEPSPPQEQQPTQPFNPAPQPFFEQPKQEEKKPFFFEPTKQQEPTPQPSFEPKQPTFEQPKQEEKQPFFFEPKTPSQPKQEEKTPFFFNTPATQPKREEQPTFQNQRPTFETNFPQKQDLPYSVTPVEETTTYMDRTQKRPTFDFDTDNSIPSLFDFKKDDFEGDKPKQVITFLSPSSAGKTTMLINVAGAIAKYSSYKPRICILDFNLLFPSVVYKLHSNDLIESEKNIYHLCSDIHHISEKLIKEVSITHEPTGIQIIYTPEDIIRDTSILNEHTIQVMIDNLKEYFDLILIDTSSNIQEDATLFPLTLADKTFVFLEPDLSSLLNTRKLITMLKQFESGSDNKNITNKLNLVLNKYNPKKNVTSELLKKTIHNYDVKVQIPEDPSISSYSNNGQFFFESNTTAAKATLDLARLIYPFDKEISLTSTKNEEKKSSGGFFTNFFKK